MPVDTQKFSSGYKGKKKPAAGSESAGFHGDLSIPGYTPKTPTGAPYSPSEPSHATDDFKEAFSPEGPPAPNPAEVEAAEAKRQAHAEARQTRLVDKFVTKAYAPPRQPSSKSSTRQPGGVFSSTSQATTKARSNVTELREKLLTHPAVQKANAEGKVVGPKGLGKIVQSSRSTADPFALKGPLSHPHAPAPGSQNALAKRFPAVTRVEEAATTKQEEGGLGPSDLISGAKDIAGGASHLYSALQHQQGSNPVGKAAEGEVAKAVSAAKERLGSEVRGTGFLHQTPSTKELEVASNAAVAAEGGPEIVKGAAKTAEVGADLLGKASTREGAKELGAAVAAKGADVVDRAKAALQVPGQLVEGARGVGTAAREAIPKAVKGAPDALRSSPEYVGKGAKGIPGFAGRAAKAGGKFAGESTAGGLHNFAVLSAAGAAHKGTGADIPGLDPLARAGALAEGTRGALEHNFWRTLGTTGRTLPALVTTPVALTEAAAESVEHGSPKPLENTAGNIVGGTKELGEELLSGDPKTVQGSVENKVGLTPFIPVPSVLKRLHDSDVYTGPRGAVRKAVESRRDAKRTKAAGAATGDRYQGGKAPKQPVPVSTRPGEHYVIPGWGKRIEAAKAKRDVALDTTRASSRAELEGHLVKKSVVEGFHGPAGKASRLARKMGPEYEAAAWPFVKYGIPHTEKGAELAKALSEYFPDPETPVPGSLTDRMAVNAAVENPDIFADKRHAEGTEAVRETQRELSRLRGKADIAPHRIQNDFTNYLSGKKGLGPVLKDYERVSERAGKFTTPEDSAAALRAHAADLDARAGKAKDETKATALRGEAAKAVADAEVIEKGGVVSREGAWAHYGSLDREYETVRKEAQKKRAQAQTATSKKAADLRDEAQVLYVQAKALVKQKRGLYSELKGYTKPTSVRDASALPVSSRAMKEAFRREQNARAKELGLGEPAYVADTKAVLPGERGVAVERPMPTRAQHFKEGSLSRSGEADARFERALQNSAVAPRTRMAINELIHNTLNERKLPVKVRDVYKHVLTQEEEEWAKRHGTWPANATALDSGLIKQGLVGAHSLDGETVGHLISAAERGGEDTPEALKALAERFPDVKDELLAAAGRKGRKSIAVEDAAIKELKEQFTTPGHPKLRAAANVPTRIILNDPAWVFAQLLATGTPIAAALGPDALLHAPRAIKTMVDIQKMPIADQARIASMVGSSAGVFGTPASAFEAARDPFSNVRAIRHSSAGRKLWNLANGEAMGKWDRWNASKMREFTAAVRSSKGFRNWYGGFKQMNDDMEAVARRTKGMKPAERLDYISRNPDLARAVQKDLNRMAGNWNSFTHLERQIAPFTIFYPWIRYSLDWTFHVFPLNHPVAATALGILAQRNSNELQQLAAAEAKKLGIEGIGADTPLSDVLAYANLVHRNAADEAVENPRGTRFSPSLGVFGELISTGDPLKALSAANPYIATGISLATGTDLFTGEKLQGGLPANLAEQTGSLIPGFRGAEAAVGFRGFTKQGHPQSATSKAYELLAGGKRQKTERSLLNPYLTRPASRGALEDDLNIVEQRIAKTGGDIQATAAGNLLQTTAKNKHEVKKLKAENKKAWREKEILLKAIDPSGALSRQAKGEYEHYVDSLPSLFESSEGGSKIFGGSSTGKATPIFGGAESSGPTSIFGASAEEKKPEYHPPKEKVKLPNIGGVIEGLLGPLSSVVGGTKADAATPSKASRWGIPTKGSENVGVAGYSGSQRTHRLGQGEAKKLLEQQGASPAIAARISANPQARAQLAAATSAGYGVTVPSGIAGAGEKAEPKKVKLPNIEGFEHQDQKEFAQWLSHYSGLPPKLAGEWVKQEGGGYSNGGEAGRNNWLGVGYPAHPTPFSESPYFNGSAKQAAKATAEWMEGKIGGEYGYGAAESIQGIPALAKSGASEEQIRAYIEGPSAWGTGAINTGGTISVNGKTTGDASVPGISVPYKAFGKHVRRDLRAVVKSKGYTDENSTAPISIHGAHGGMLIREVQGSSGVASVIDKNKDPEIAARLLLLSAKTGQPVYVLSGSRTPAQSEAVGGFPDDPHTKGEAMDIGVGSPTLASAAAIPESVYESVGLYRPFGTAQGGSAAEDNHVQLLNGGTPPTGSYEPGAPTIAGAVPAGGLGSVIPGGAVPSASTTTTAKGSQKAKGSKPAQRGTTKAQKLREVERLYQGKSAIPGYSASAVSSLIPGFASGRAVPTIDLAAIGAALAKEKERLAGATR